MMPESQFSLSTKVSSQLEESDCLFVVTGAGGWLGRATLVMLQFALGSSFMDRVLAVGSKDGAVRLLGRDVPVVALEKADEKIGQRTAFLFHYAFLTKDKVGLLAEKDYIARNDAISATVRNWIRDMDVKWVLMPSSGAVYDFLQNAGRDPSANSYGALKHQDELRFQEICAAAHARLVIPRVFNMSGPFINKFDAYVLASIIVDILNGGPIVLKSPYPVVRSYTYIGDLLEVCVRWLFTSAHRDCLIFDTAGSEKIEVGALAARAGACLSRPGIAIERPPVDSSRENLYVGDGALMADLVSQLGCELTGLDEQIKITANYIEEALKRAH